MDSPCYHSYLLLLQKSSLLRAQLRQNGFIWSENPGIKYPSLPGTESTDRADGVDQETPDHGVTRGRKAPKRHLFLTNSAYFASAHLTSALVS